MSNYPPGVSGDEYAISGPEIEFVLDGIACPICAADYLFQSHPDHGGWLACDCVESINLPDGPPKSEFGVRQWALENLEYRL